MGCTSGQCPDASRRGFWVWTFLTTALGSIQSMFLHGDFSHVVWCQEVWAAESTMEKIWELFRWRRKAGKRKQLCKLFIDVYALEAQRKAGEMSTSNGESSWNLWLWGILQALEDLVLLTLLSMAEVDIVKASRNIKAKTYHIYREKLEVWLGRTCLLVELKEIVGWKAGKTALQLRAVVALAKKLGSVPNTRMMAHNHSQL